MLYKTEEQIQTTNQHLEVYIGSIGFITFLYIFMWVVFSLLLLGDTGTSIDDRTSIKHGLEVLWVIGLVLVTGHYFIKYFVKPLVKRADDRIKVLAKRIDERTKKTT